MPERYVVIWPHYLDASLPRRLGRKVPKDMAVPKPTLDELINACKELNLNFEVNATSKYCRVWYSSGGSVIVYSNLKKLMLLRKIASKIKESRNLRGKSSYNVDGNVK